MFNFENIPDETWVKYFKYACIAEGISCILLYLIAMPIKYQFGIWWQMIPIGTLHGIFFTWYLAQSVLVRKIIGWDDEDFVFVILAAFFPMGTFWVEKKMINSEK